MKSILFKFISLSILWSHFTLCAFSADLDSLDRLFIKRFYLDWEENRCGENTERFVRAAFLSKIDLSRTLMVGAEDVMGYFGMISGYQSREGGPLIRPTPSNPPYHLAGRSNWYFHAFLVAQETVNPKRLGRVAVYDLSFKNDPTILGLSKYLDQMYMPENTTPDMSSRNKYLGTIQFRLYDATQYVTLGQSKSKVSDEKYLKDYYPSYFVSPDPNDLEFFSTIYRR